VGIRPEHALVDPQGALAMKVLQVEQLGSSSLLHGLVGADTPFEVVCAGQTRVVGGDTVHITLQPQHLHCFDSAGNRI